MNAIASSTKSVLALIDDWAAFGLLTNPCQIDILSKLDCIHKLNESAPSKRGTTRAHLALKLNIGESTISRWLSHYQKGNQYAGPGVLALVDYRKFPKESGLPTQFISYVKGIYDNQDRTDDAAEVQRDLLDRLALWRQTGDPKWEIKGYQYPPKNQPRQNHPHGWSPRNILRIKPKARTRALTKLGEKEAANFLPNVLTTRVGSAFLSRILFDDQDHDHLVSGGSLSISGVTESVRPVEFAALDFFTACHLDQHLRLEYPQTNAAGKKTKKTLTGEEFQWFGIHILQTKGFRTDALGTELIGEHKTAAFWQAKGRTALGGQHSFADCITAATSGHVRIAKSGLYNTPALAGAFFCPQSTGNYKFKTWIESAFRLVRTYMQGVIGQTGSHARLNGNAKNYGIQKRESQLLRFVEKQNICEQQACLVGAIIEDAPDFIQTKLQSSLLSFPEFYQVIQGVYRAINLRTNHNLEGWHEAGFVQQLWRPNLDTDNWFSESELNDLDPIERSMMVKRINTDPLAYTREHKLSPQHAADHCSQADQKVITKLHDSIVPTLLPADMAHEVKVGSNHTFSLVNSLWPDTRDTYIANITTETGLQAALQPGHQLLVFASPFGDGKAFLVDRNTQKYLGTIHSTVRAAAYDHKAKLDQLAARNSLRTTLDAPVNARNRDIAAEEQARELRNTRLMTGEETDPHARRTTGAKKAQVTGRANRVNSHAASLDQTHDLTESLAPALIPTTDEVDGEEEIEVPFL